MIEGDTDQNFNDII